MIERGFLMSKAIADQRTLKQGELPALDGLLKLLGLCEYFDGDMQVIGNDPLLQSPHRLAEATAFALLTEAASACAIQRFNQQDKAANNLSINLQDAIHFLHSSHFLWQSGYPMSVGAEYIPTNGIFECRDKKYIMIESGPPYIKLERGYLNFFDCGNNRDSLARAISKFDGEDLQEQLSQIGLPACLAYSREEWLSHAQGAHLAEKPVIEIEKIGEGRPISITSSGKAALEDVKVLDFTHVLAGPRSMRTLANYGAQVLHISSPYHQDTLPQNLLVNQGKHSAYLDLNNEAEKAQMLKLAGEADVFATSYRPTVNSKFNLTPELLAKDHRGIICLSINAYGHSGPWQNRPGFDQNAQVASGFAVKEGERQGKPKFSPVFYLNDFLTAYLASSGVMSALLQRASQGGSYHVKVSLARSAMWVQDLGCFAEQEYIDKPEKDIYPCLLQENPSPFGTIKELACAVAFERSPLTEIIPVRPFGADPACFWR